MDYNKGRFVPNINLLSLFSKSDARTPFEGELCLDDETNDICFWKQNAVTNLWENVSRTREIQEYLDGYENDTTFPAVKAFVATEIIHRLFYNKHDMTCWLDGSVDIEGYEYSYYAVKSLNKINGSQRYITGLFPHDGLNYENALISVSQFRAPIVFEILPNIWYAVEFYDSNKTKNSTIYFTSYPSKSLPIEKDIRPLSIRNVDGKMIREMNNRVINLNVKFNQSVELNKGFLYVGQDVNELKPSVVKSMAGGHLCYAENNIAKIPYLFVNSTTENVTLKYFMDILNADDSVKNIDGRSFMYLSINGDSAITAENESIVIQPGNSIKIYAVAKSNEKVYERISLDEFDKIDTSKPGEYDCGVIYKHIISEKANKKYKVNSYQVSVIDKNDVILDLDEINLSRKYIKVSVEQIGDAEYNDDIEYSITQINGVDVITIPREYFGLGHNVVKIIYVEDCVNPLVKCSDLKIHIPVKVIVKEDEFIDIDKFIPAGYITNPSRGLYHINLKYFAHYNNGRIEDVTNKVTVLKNVDKSVFGITQNVSVKLTVDHIGKVERIFNFTVFCTDPSISGNNSRVIINGSSTPRILFYNGESFSLGVFGASNSMSSVSLESLLSSPVLRFNEHAPTHIRVREIEDSTKLYTDIVDNADKLIYISKLTCPMYISPKEDTTIGDILDSDVIDGYDNYVFQHYSMDNGEHPVSDEEKAIACPKNRLVFIENEDGAKIYPVRVYTKNSAVYSVSKDKPFLVEGYYKDETGRYICTGGIIHYAETQ